MILKNKHRHLMLDVHQPASALLAGVGNKPPRGKPASPGTANCLVDNALNSRIAAKRENDFNISQVKKLVAILDE